MEKDIKTTSGSTGRTENREVAWNAHETDTDQANACADFGLRRPAILANLSSGVICIERLSAGQGRRVNLRVKSRAKCPPDHAKAESAGGKVA